MKKKVAAAVAACVLAGCLGSAGAFAADETVAWSMDTDCTVCHTKEAAAHALPEAAEANADSDDAAAAEAPAEVEEADDASTKADAAKATESDASDADEAVVPLAALHGALPCTSCHSDEEALEKVHDGVTADDRMPKRLRKAKIGEELCLTCHGSYEELASATEEDQMLVDGLGTAVNPHDLPEVEDHQKLDCLDCHAMHKEQSSMETAMNTCTGCHHTGTFECGTCH